MGEKKRLAILLTCYNRKELTERCLKSLLGNVNSVSVDTYLVDDGCTDGTGDMVRSTFPSVNVLHGDGSLFWNKGMHFAFSEAVKSSYDFYLWVNDDVEFYPNMIDRLVASYNYCSINKKDIIIVGPTLDKTEKVNTYGGVVIQKSIIPLKMVKLNYTSEYQKCDTFYGNCVLIPKNVVEKIGVIDSFYSHKIGDTAYGLSAVRAGCENWLINYPVGICEKHNKDNEWEDKRLSIKQRYIALNSVKGIPKKDWKYFCKKYCGLFWTLRYCTPSIRILIESIEN